MDRTTCISCNDMLCTRRYSLVVKEYAHSITQAGDVYLLKGEKGYRFYIERKLCTNIF